MDNLRVRLDRIGCGSSMWPSASLAVIRKCDSERSIVWRIHRLALAEISPQGNLDLLEVARELEEPVVDQDDIALPPTRPDRLSHQEALAIGEDG